MPLLRSYLGAKRVGELAHLNIHDVEMEYSGGRFTVQADNWSTGIVAKENADTVIPEIAAALVKSSLFEQTDPPQGLVS